jgi:tetratricopeptide (TPR) repeat protein
MAEVRPLVLVLEDLHWAEPTLFELVDFLAEAEAPILLLGTARPELRELRPELYDGGERRTAIVLSALGDEHSEALLAALLGDRKLPPGSRAEALLRNAAGNPLFLEETVRMLDEAGVLDGTGDLAELAVPTSLQAMIGSRLDGLPAEDKSVAHHASVVGMTFWSGAVEELHGAGDSVDPSLEALEHRDVVRSADASSLAEEREWSFKHAMIRDVAYARVPKGRRAHLHVRFADWIQGIPGAAEELVEILAYHLEQACRHSGVGRSDAPPPVERAVDALMAAAEKAERRAGVREADRYYARGLELVGEEETEQTLELRLGRAGTLNRLGDFKAAGELFARIAEAAPALGREDIRGWALVKAANIELKQALPDDARPHLEEAAALGAKLGVVPLQIWVLFESANLHSWVDGDLDPAVADLRRALALGDAGDDMSLRIEGRMRLVMLLYNLGELREAEDELAECAALLEQFSSLRYEALAACLLGMVKRAEGEIDEAERQALTAHELLERTGERFFGLQNLRTLALCALARDDVALAELRLREALPVALEIGGWLTVEIYRCLVDVLIRRDRLDDAREHAALAREHLPEADVYARAASLLADASVSTAEGRLDAADERFADALRLLEQQRLPLDLGEARLAYGRALRRLGEEMRARDELVRAHEELRIIGALGLLAEIERELAELPEGAGSTSPLGRS